MVVCGDDSTFKHLRRWQLTNFSYSYRIYIPFARLLCYLGVPRLRSIVKHTLINKKKLVRWDYKAHSYKTFYFFFADPGPQSTHAKRVYKRSRD